VYVWEATVPDVGVVVVMDWSLPSESYVLAVCAPPLKVVVLSRPVFGW
jgi:hypothetical protein